MRTRFRPLVLLLAGIGLLISIPSAAQEVQLRPLELNPLVKKSVDAPRVASAADMDVIHVTDRLTNSPEGQQALRNYIDARDAGLLASRKSARRFPVGEERSFNILHNVATVSPEWKSATFVLRFTSDVANIWIEKALVGEFSADQLNELSNYLLEATPSSSYRSENGIIENNNLLFGSPPDYDGDGIVDILLYDIVEGVDFGNAIISGYVHATDINPGARTGEGNQADVLYLDLPDRIRRGVSAIAETAAHEYQHLINYAYQSSPGSELVFVNEGLSEWAIVANGFMLDRMTYLQDRAEHSTRLMEWRRMSPDRVLFDYQRAGLFTTYIAERVGPEATGSITRARMPEADGGHYAFGEEGYRVVLEENGTTYESVVGDFHTANFVNDTSLGISYGYSSPVLQGVRALSTDEIDGTSRSQFQKINFPINPGAVRYVSWTQITNLSLQMDVFGEIADELKEYDRKQLHLRVYKEFADGRREIETILPRWQAHEFRGDFSRVTLIITSSAPQSGSTQLELNSSWDEAGSSGVVRQTVSYEDGKVDTLFYSMPKEAMLANKFPVPENGRLASVLAAPVYENDFGNSSAPAGAPRDFQLRVWRENANGGPGEEVFSTDVTESPTTRHLNFSTRQFTFVEVILPDTSVLAALGDSIFVGLANRGTDINYLALTPARNPDVGNVSYLYFPFANGAGWAPFDAITVGDEPIFNGTVHPIRAEFVVATSSESDDATELPSAVTLSQNYPNPFNPSTSIDYTLPRAMQVRLSVYDALGRLVATVTDGVQAAGAHEVQLNAGGWASGVYFYTLETEAQTVSKHMVLMK